MAVMKLKGSLVKIFTTLLLAVFLSPSGMAEYPWGYGYTNPTTAPAQPATQQQTQNLPAGPEYWGGYRYRPLQQRPGLPPNSSGTPESAVPQGYVTRTPDGGYSYSYSRRTPDGGYSYSFHVQRHGGAPAARYPQTTPVQQAAPPRVEATLSERRPMVQQNLVYRIRVTSRGNLQQATPVLPKVEGLIFRQLGTPRNYRGASNEVITEYTYLLIPVRAGSYQLPPPSVEGRYTNDLPFQARGEHGTTLYVQPAPSGVSPWLPLYDLQIQSRIEGGNRARAGEPLTLEIVTTAVGAVGSQLPSVAGQLKSEDFYIYPGEVTEEGHISADGLDLLGTRTERFTLVPRYGGRLTLPSLSIPWWNLRTGKAATATLPMRQLEVAGPVGDNRRALEESHGIGAGNSLYFWVPLGIVGLLLLLGWLKVILGHGRIRFSGWQGRRPWRGQLGRLQAPVAAALQRLSLRRHLHRFRTWLGRRLPVSWKLWYCLRAVHRETDPGAWEHALQILAAKHLGARPNASLAELAEIITRCHPAANASEVKRLLEELEASNYGGRPIPSFEAWKADFEQQIRPRLFPIRLRHCTLEDRREQGLPQLNPTQ